MTKIDTSKTVELYDTRDGKTFASSEYGDNQHRNGVWGLRVFDMGHGRIACSYGHNLCAYALFVYGEFDEAASTPFQLAKGSVGIRNAPAFEDKLVYHQTFEQSGVPVEYFGSGRYCYELRDLRGYSYVVVFEDTGLDYISAGCRRWDTFNEARNHYGESYSSDGNRHEVLKMLEVLEGWFDDAKEEAFPSSVVEETDYERLKGTNTDDGRFPKTTIPMLETEFLVKLDPYENSFRVAIDFSYRGDCDPPNFYWLKKEEVERLRDFFNEVLDDWGKSDDADVPF